MSFIVIKMNNHKRDSQMRKSKWKAFVIHNLDSYVRKVWLRHISLDLFWIEIGLEKLDKDKYGWKAVLEIKVKVKKVALYVYKKRLGNIWGLRSMRFIVRH